MKVTTITVVNPDLLQPAIETFLQEQDVTDIVNIIPITVAVPKKVKSLFSAPQAAQEMEYQFRFIIIYE